MRLPPRDAPRSPWCDVTGPLTSAASVWCGRHATWAPGAGRLPRIRPAERRDSTHLECRAAVLHPGDDRMGRPSPAAGATPRLLGALTRQTLHGSFGYFLQTRNRAHTLSCGAVAKAVMEYPSPVKAGRLGKPTATPPRHPVEDALPPIPPLHA